MIVGYLLIWTAYGWWLPNDPRGRSSHAIRVERFADLGELHHGRKVVQPNSQELRQFYANARDALKHPLLTFSSDEVQTLAEGFATVISEQNYTCYACAIMPDHVHAIVWFPEPDQISHFMKQWKQRSSIQIKRLIGSSLIRYAETIDLAEPIWQAGYYGFNLYSEGKVEEKLAYMHLNPVGAGLVERPSDWPWNSSRFYETGRSVGLPVGWLG